MSRALPFRGWLPVIALCVGLTGGRAVASEPAAASVFDAAVPREAIPGFKATEHPLPLPTTMSHIDYEQLLFPFIRSRAYATELGWSHDKQVRDTGSYVKGKYYGTHPAVRCFYSPKVMYWLTGDPDFWPEGRDAGLAPKKLPREGTIPDGGMCTLTTAPVSFAAASAPAFASTQKNATPLVTNAIFGGSLGEAFMRSIDCICRLM